MISKKYPLLTTFIGIILLFCSFFILLPNNRNYFPENKTETNNEYNYYNYISTIVHKANNLKRQVNTKSSLQKEKTLTKNNQGGDDNRIDISIKTFTNSDIKTNHSPSKSSGPLRLIQMQPQKYQDSENNDVIALFVHNSVFQDIEESLFEYQEDLLTQGYNSITYIYEDGSPESLRSFLQVLKNEQPSLNGAIFIGDIPHIIYEMNNNWGPYGDGGYEDFPCDLFFMDLDGEWLDILEDGEVQPGNGKYDTHQGGVDMDIWVSRMKVDNLPDLGNENEILTNYFNKNHNFRTGNLSPQKRALIYNDDAWQSEEEPDIEKLQPIYSADNIVAVSAPETTTAEDFINNHLPAEYEYMLVRAHGIWGEDDSHKGHVFFREDHTIWEPVSIDDYQEKDPSALFYDIGICKGTNYLRENYLAGIFTFNDNPVSGLLSWGSTKTGAMEYDEKFYSSINEGKTSGESFKLWLNDQDLNNPTIRSYLYGMVIIGDGSLTPKLNKSTYVSPLGSDINGNGSKTNPYKTIGHALNVVKNNNYISNTLKVAGGEYDENIKVDEDNIIIKGGYYKHNWNIRDYMLHKTELLGSGEDFSSKINYPAPVVTITADNVVFDGFWVKNIPESEQYASIIGGILVKNSKNVSIKHNVVQDIGSISKTTSGCGIWIIHSNNINVSDNSIQDNSASGVYFNDSDFVSITNNIISWNKAWGIYRASGEDYFVEDNDLHNNLYDYKGI